MTNRPTGERKHRFPSFDDIVAMLHDPKTCPDCRRKPQPERTLGEGSGYLRGMPFWTHVTTSHGRETR